MNRTANTIMRSNEYYQMNKKKLCLIGAVLLFIILLFSVFFITKTVTAQKNTDRCKLVTSIEIEKGDTLWSIALEFSTEEYNDMNEYIEEIKDSNGMITDEIHAGNYIIVPYYVDAAEGILVE